MILASPILPPWLVLPLGLFTLVVVAAHLHLMHGDTTMPPSRKRIRTANGVVMLFATPLIAFAFGILSPADVRTFTITWAAIIGLLFVILLLAGLDALNTLRLHASDRSDLHETIREARKRVKELRERTDAESSERNP